MIIITGAAGFIASNVVRALNDLGRNDLLLVDKFDRPDRVQNYEGKKYIECMDRAHFIGWLNVHHDEVSWVIHLGARTDTTEFDKSIFDELNVLYSKDIWDICTLHSIPLIYASSAATYGDGDLGYRDDHDIVNSLKPLNPYGQSKNDFDAWALSQTEKPPFWAGLKFFNVYGPNEYHKGRMASVVMHTFNQIQENEHMKLFRSHNPHYTDGGQLRDFIYVKDVAKVIMFLMEIMPESGLYNLGTGKARTFMDLATSTFRALDLEPNISFIDTPEDIRDKYQYFTEADMKKLFSAGYDEPFTSLELGVKDYVQNYLSKNDTH